MAVLDRVYGQLRMMGGWRELLWRTAGHYDHIHVAHQGGVVSPSWYRSPGDRHDERTTRLQVGETVLPRGATSGNTNNYNLTVVNRERVNIYDEFRRMELLAGVL